jgi:hypothetical protein
MFISHVVYYLHVSVAVADTDGVCVSLVPIKVWGLAKNTLNNTCNFLYYNHQVHRDFLITLI